MGLTLFCGAERDQNSRAAGSGLPGSCPRLRPAGVIQQRSNVPHIWRKLISYKIECRAHCNQKALGAVEQLQYMACRRKTLTCAGLIQHRQPLIHHGEVLVRNILDLFAIFRGLWRRQATSYWRDSWQRSQTDCWREERARDAGGLRSQCRSEQGGVAQQNIRWRAFQLLARVSSAGCCRAKEKIIVRVSQTVALLRDRRNARAALPGNKAKPCRLHLRARIRTRNEANGMTMPAQLTGRGQSWPKVARPSPGRDKNIVGHRGPRA